ncbi:MAG: glutamate--tRNA ligase [Chitinophagaceae bacterium]
MKKIRVRFAPSPTGGLHLGGVRTVLYNYLFARQHDGDFILRIEDTDQSRFVEGAEQYIIDCLKWCGLTPDEGPVAGGPVGPYRQSERKQYYGAYAQQLIDAGYAYMAFDTPEELEQMREQFKTVQDPQPQYNHRLREQMRNSLTLGEKEVKSLIDAGTPYVIRIAMPVDEELSFTDMIRGEVTFKTGLVDDKVLIKADGMPTYHLAVVVDDYLMKITHAFRGEEWLPSAPVHLLLWKYLGWQSQMPQWAHLPLILKPEGHGKLSKRDGDRLGFPVFAMEWTDPKTDEQIEGFKEKGFLPEAFVNLLAMLGWNDGSEKEIFTLPELISSFSIDRVHKGGARFDYEKAKWFNHAWIQRLSDETMAERLVQFSPSHYGSVEISYLIKVIAAVKERCHLLTDFWQQSSFFFEAPSVYDNDSVKPKWKDQHKEFYLSFIERMAGLKPAEAGAFEQIFKELAAEKQIKPGELQMFFRIMLVGGKFGPPVFEITSTIGLEQTIKRIELFLAQIS